MNAKMRNGLLIIFSSLMIFSVGCNRTETPFRFIDRLTEKNVILSPMKASSAPSGQQSLDREWLDSFIKEIEVHDPLIGKNPWSLQKKLVLDSEAASVLMAVPPTEIRFRVKIPPRCSLQFGYGLYAKEWGENARATIFEILVEEARPSPRIFQESLTLLEMNGHRRGIRREIDLAAYQNKTVTLIFRTHAARPLRPDEVRAFALKNGLAFWINPVIIQKREPGSRPASNPNIILISIDTTRADHLGLYGYHPPTSPAAERLARDGALFQKCFSAAPYTLTSHATMLTGLNPARHQTLNLTDGLPADVPTLAEILREAGYETAALTGGGQLDVQYGFAKGFDQYDEWSGANQLVDSADNLRRNAAQWLESRRDSKFFLFLHTYQPHNPYHSPEFPGRESFLRKDFPWNRLALQEILGQGFPHLFRSFSPLERENIIALYDLDIRYTDQFLVGPLIEDLKRLGLYENSLIILTSDHGEEFFDHGSWEHGHSLYNELIHVPLVIKFPQARYAGRKIDRAVGLVDLAPTILSAAGVPPPSSKFDGENLIPLLDGKEGRDRVLMSFMPTGFVYDFPSRVAVIRGNYKLILNGDFLPGAENYFSPPPPPRIPIELFNLAEDPGEKINLVDRESALVRELLPLARSYLQEAASRANQRKLTLDKNLEDQLKSLGYIR